MFQPPIQIPAGLDTTEPATINGLLGTSTITLSFQVVCQPGFIGADCRQDPGTISENTPTPTTETTSRAPVRETTEVNPSETIGVVPTETTDTPDRETDEVPVVAETTTSEAPSSVPSDSSIIAGVVGAATGSVAVVVLVLVFTAVCLGLLLCYRRRNKKAATPTVQYNNGKGSFLGLCLVNIIVMYCRRE